MKLEKNIMANWRLWAYLRLVQLEGGFSVYHRFGSFGASWNKYILQHPSRLLNSIPKIGGFKEGLPAQIIESWSKSRGVLFAASSIIANTILSIP
jgi:hypothetical protein